MRVPVGLSSGGEASGPGLDGVAVTGRRAGARTARPSAAAVRRRARLLRRAEGVLRQVLAEAPPPEPVILPVPRPVDQERLAADLLPLDEAPVAAVLLVVAVVAHDEVRALRHHRRLAAVE